MCADHGRRARPIRDRRRWNLPPTTSPPIAFYFLSSEKKRPASGSTSKNICTNTQKSSVLFYLPYSTNIQREALAGHVHGLMAAGRGVRTRPCRRSLLGMRMMGAVMGEGEEKKVYPSPFAAAACTHMRASIYLKLSISRRDERPSRRP